jgi:peroxiredoxin
MRVMLRATPALSTTKAHRHGSPVTLEGRRFEAPCPVDEETNMTIQVGDHLPQVTFRVNGPEGPEAKTTDDLFKGRRVVLVGVPGAFTPSCHRNHLPGFVAHKDEILSRGVDAIAVTSVNDVFVLNAWKKESSAEGIEFLADGNAEFAKATGLDMDGTGFGLGPRSKRYSMLVDDGVVRVLHLEEVPVKTEISGAEALLKVI